MVMPWLLFLIPIVSCHEVYESAEVTYNITTLYPVTNNTINKFDHNRNQKNNTETSREKYKTNIVDDEDHKQNYEKNEKSEVIMGKNQNVSKWKLNATYVQPKDVESDDSKSTESKEILTVSKPASKIVEKEFKPSPHLGSFFDDDNLSLSRFSTPKPHFQIEKKPALDFTSAKDLYMLNYKSPEHPFREQTDVPYRYEDSYIPKTNWQLDSKPTVESPTKIPAGGLYKHPDPFKEKPSSNGDDDDFGLAFNEDGKQKENPLKKRSNPWKHLLSLVTAFIPVGLIISALTPSIITIQSTENDPQSRDKATFVRKHCYKIHCEDPDALHRVLHWLLAHRPNRYHSGFSTQPEPAHHNQYKGDQYNLDTMRHHRSFGFT